MSRENKNIPSGIRIYGAGGAGAGKSHAAQSQTKKLEKMRPVFGDNKVLEFGAAVCYTLDGDKPNIKEGGASDVDVFNILVGLASIGSFVVSCISLSKINSLNEIIKTKQQTGDIHSSNQGTVNIAGRDVNQKD